MILVTLCQTYLAFKGLPLQVSAIVISVPSFPLSLATADAGATTAAAAGIILFICMLCALCPSPNVEVCANVYLGHGQIIIFI